MKVGFVSVVFLDTLFERLRTEKCLNSESLLEYLTEWRYINLENLTLLKTGLDRYFADDFVSAIHILVPQYEDVLRTFLEKAASDTGIGAAERTVIKSRRRVRGWQYETFGDLLQRDFTRTKFPDDVRDYIRIVMAEQNGLNLRNKVAHGLILPSDCTASTVNIVLHLFLLLRIFPPRAESEL